MTIIWGAIYVTAEEQETTYEVSYSSTKCRFLPKDT